MNQASGKGRAAPMGWLLAWLLLMPMLACAKGPDTRAAVLVVGDSLSAAHNIPAASGWVNLLQQRVKQQITPPPAIINASISGETTAGALTRLPGLLEKHRPSVVVIELGGNDALRGLTPAQLRGNLEKMIDRACRQRCRGGGSRGCQGLPCRRRYAAVGPRTEGAHALLSGATFVTRQEHDHAAR